MHLCCLTQLWNFYFLAALTLRVWRTTWKTPWTSPNLGADLLRTCTEAAIYPRQLATASPARAGTPRYGKAPKQAAGDLQTASARVRRVRMVFQLGCFSSSRVIVLSVLRWKEVLSQYHGAASHSD